MTVHRQQARTFMCDPSKRVVGFGHTWCARRAHLVSRLATPRAQIGLTSCHIATPLRAMYPTSTRRLCFRTVPTRGECVPSASQLVSKSAPVRAERVPQSRRSRGRVARRRVNLKKFNIFPRRCTQWRLRAHLVPSPRDASSPVRATARPCARRRAWRAVALLRATRARGVTRRGARWNEVCARWARS